MDHDPLDLRGQAKTQADSALRSKLARENEEADLKWLMSSKRGRRIVWRHLARAGVFRSSFRTNALEMAHAEGWRDYARHILESVNTLCPELYPVMVKEQKNDAEGGTSASD